MISRRELIGALVAARVADWVVIERVQERASVGEARGVRRRDHRTRWSVIVHHDLPQGRGSARIDLDALVGDARTIVDQAIELATAAVGPTWRSTPPAAPARVELLDPTLATADLEAAAAGLLTTLRRPPGADVSASVELMRERVSVNAGSGFRTSWRASEVRAEALVATGERSVAITREARRTADLDLEGALAETARDLALIARAAAPAPGRCDLVLRTETLLHGGGLGMWAVFADQASAEVERQGLTRYRPHAPIVPGADQVAEPLTITSNGALAFGLRSSPVGDEGDAVRQFVLIDKGIAVGLGLSMREAARRERDPNGGVRNLVVAPGTWTDRALVGRTLDIRRLRSLSIDPYTGDASLEIALAIDREGPTERPITGGTVRLDLVAALARARRSETTHQRGGYVGPTAVLIEDAELLAM